MDNLWEGAVDSSGVMRDDAKLAALLQEQECQLFWSTNQVRAMQTSCQPSTSNEGGVEHPNSTQEQEPAEVLDDEELARRLQMEEDIASGVLQQFYRQDSPDVDPTVTDTLGLMADQTETLTYEDLNDLGQFIGNASRGYSEEQLNTLTALDYAALSKVSRQELPRSCTICLEQFEDGDKLVQLRCNHAFHEGCIRRWLADNKVCPMCHREALFEQGKT